MKSKREDFKILRNNQKLIYLDYAATTFMPDIVVDAWVEFQENIGVSLNRSNGILAQKSIEIYNTSKNYILDFFNANENYIIAFSKNATESLNMLSYCYTRNLHSGDLIIISPYEHHSNILPLKRYAEDVGAIVVSLPLKTNGEIEYDFLKRFDINKIKIVSLNFLSNVNGHLLDLNKLFNIIDREKTKIILDISQAVGHIKMDLKSIGADAYALSAHKMYGPKNVGAAIIKKTDMSNLPPFLLGGGMVWNSLSAIPEWQNNELKFIAGTHDIGLIYAWSIACKYLKEIGMENINNTELHFYNYIYSHLKNCPNIIMIPSFSGALISFYSSKYHAHDLAELLTNHNIEIRTGHMCAQSILDYFNVTNLCRISWGVGTRLTDFDKLIKILMQQEGNNP